MKNFVLCIATILLSFPGGLFSQVNEFHYSDTEIKENANVAAHLKYNNSIIIAGKSFGPKGNIPFISCIDTLGNVQWNTAIYDTSTYTNINSIITKLLLGCDNFIYAYCEIKQELWKVNPANGTIMWKKNFPSLSFYSPRTIIDFDSTKFIIPYCSAYNGFYYTVRFAFIKKNTGDTLSTHYLGNAPWQDLRYSITTDPQKNIYCSIFDTVYKRSGAAPANITWKSQYPAAQISDLHTAYFDTVSSSLIMIGKSAGVSCTGRILKINPVNGVLSATAQTQSDVEFQDLKYAGGFLYITWRHLYVGGFQGFFRTTKYDINTGSVVWGVITQMPGLGTPDVHSGTSGESAISLDTDNAGDVYLTGYYGDANYGPENWGIMKLNGSTGAPQYQLTIANDSTKYNNISCGMAACIINNKPYFVGDLETYYVNYAERNKIALVKLNSAGNIILRKYCGTNHQFPSKTVSIQRYAPSKTLVVKQVGRATQLEMYDFSKTLLWQKTLLRDYYLLAGDVEAAPNGDIYLTASAKGFSATAPYYGLTDSMYVFKYDGNGSLLAEFSFSVGVNNAAPIDLQADNNGALFFYQKNNIVFFRKITTNLSAEVNPQVNYFSLAPKVKYTFNKNSQDAYLFGISASTAKAFKINKNTLTTNSLTVLNGIYFVNYAAKLDTNLVILCGSLNAGLGGEAITLFNTSVNDTIWTKQFPSSMSAQTIKCVADPLKNNLYTIGTFSNNITVRRISKSNGVQKWSYMYNGSANLSDFPYDISYDPIRDQVLVTGYETSGSSKNAVILILDTAGTLVNTLVKTGDFPGDNIATCVNTLYDGTQWAGGFRNKNSFGLAGFVYELTIPTFSLFSNFSASALAACSGQNVQFTDLSTNSPTSWSWSVSPSGSAVISNSISANPSIGFSSPGFYTVSMTASNSNGPGTTAIQIVTVSAYPALFITGSTTSVCAGSSVSISASGAQTYTWSNNGGNLSTAVFTPTASTIYTLFASNSNCAGNATIAITAVAVPTLTINSTPSGSVCAGNSLTLSVSGASAYTWSNGSTNTVIIITPTASAVYSVSGTLMNACSSSASASINVLPVPVITVNSGSVCSGQSFTISPSGASTYTFSSGSPIVSPTATTSYSVTGTNNFGCVNNNATLCTVTVSPSPNLSAGNASICVGQTYTLSPSGANTYSFSSNTPVVSPSVSTSYTISGSSSTGCTSSIVTLVTVYPIPSVNISANNTIVCEGQNIALNASGAISYSWNTGSSLATITMTPATTTIYSVTGYNSPACSASAAITVSVIPKISVVQGSICIGQGFIMNPTGAYSYTYSNGSSFVSPTVTTVYTITGTSAYGCISSVACSVQVNPLPVISVQTSSSLSCAGSQVTLTASGANTYTWNPGSIVGNPITVIAVNTTVYTINAKDINGCFSTVNFTQGVSLCTSLESVNAEKKEWEVFPNPTNDEITIRPTRVGDVAKVFNSLGQIIEVKRTTQPSTLLNLHLVANGVYYIEITSVDGIKVLKIIKQ